MAYKIELNNFEGPLDLLLYFIRRDELDIYDIPISKITKDFIEMIDKWEMMNIVVAGEFIVMASTLMRVKAKMMIPRPQLDDEGEVIDPRTELMQQLIDYKRFRDGAEMLNELALKRKNNVPRQFFQNISESEKEDLGVYFQDITLFDLARFLHFESS